MFGVVVGRGTVHREVTLEPPGVCIQRIPHLRSKGTGEDQLVAIPTLLLGNLAFYIVYNVLLEEVGDSGCGSVLAFGCNPHSLLEEPSKELNPWRSSVLPNKLGKELNPWRSSALPNELGKSRR